MSLKYLDGYTVRVDQNDHIRFVDHSDKPYLVSNLSPDEGFPEIASRYLSELIGYPANQILLKEDAAFKGNHLLFSESTTMKGVEVVSFLQRFDEYNLFKTGVSVSFDRASRSVLSAAFYYDYDNTNPAINPDAVGVVQAKMGGDYLASKLKAEGNLKRFSLMIGQEIKTEDIEWIINKQESKIYRYDAARRQSNYPVPKEDRDFPIIEVPELILDEVPGSIKDGDHFLMAEVYFSTKLPFTTLHFHMLIEPESESVLYIRPGFQFMTDGMVYDVDPLTKTGSPAITPASPLAAQNYLRSPRPMSGLIPSMPQGLSGQYVYLDDTNPPIVAPPTITSGNFDYDVPTDNFSAVNAYYHSDATFRMVEDMGFDIGVYFDGTSFPVRVDHRGFFNCVNAAAPGNGNFDGSGGYYYGLAQWGSSVGIATDVRIVLHEFGHAVLWDNVHSANLNIAHSIGDSLAVLFAAPGSQAPDKGLTFPWLDLLNPGQGLDRRHDRPTSTWAWGGTNDNGGYDSEQILSSSHYRAYRILGGDSPNISEQTFASRQMLHLIYHAVGTLTPLTNPNTPEDWAWALQSCDLATRQFECHPGGLMHKVIRYAFQQQGAYQPVGAPSPVTTAGAPPFVDFYINDGRNGQYYWLEDTCNSMDIWNRHMADGNAAHQKPIPGQPNFAYVIVRNQGSSDSKGYVRAFHSRRCKSHSCCNKVKDLIWPNDFKPMKDDISPEFTVLAGGYTIMGPFEWIPDQGDVMLFAVDAKGDSSNIHRMDPDLCVALKHLVPFDNNIAVRDPWLECCC